MADIRKNLLLFFERPTEPCFLPKGKDNVVFRIPERYRKKYFNVILRLAKKVDAVLSHFGHHSKHEHESGVAAHFIDVLDIDLPDLSLPLQLPRDEQFSVFLATHQKMARRLIEVFMGMPDLRSLLAVCVYCQLHVNALMFIYCLSVALLHRPDTKGIEIPTFAETFPDIFVDRETMNRARALCYILPRTVEHPVVTIDLPPIKIPEQRVAYFREDVGINSHHWHWHLVYPGLISEGVVVNKDRRGELFYYMHHQIIARYDTERLCNGLERTIPFKNLREPIAEGYFPRLDSKNASRSWALRFDNVTLQDLDNEDKTSIAQMETWAKNIMEAVDTMTVLRADGTSMPLDEETGIDILGNLVESTMLSVNKNHYGDFHNQGHVLVASVHDPKGYHSEPLSVMGNTATAMRDPFFYRWHAYINEIFIAFKNKLAPYKSDKLAFPDIAVSSIHIKGMKGQDVSKTFHTLWERSTMNLRNGLDFVEQRDFYANFKYLQHEEFQYEIKVNNTTGAYQIGTVRIFMAPRLDAKGHPLGFEEQRKLMIEMDKFSHEIQPGKNIIHRKSTESSVTIPYERILRKKSKEEETAAARNSNYCDCGWPQNMLLPKGTEDGYPVVLFVMVSNWNEDKVDQDQPKKCKDNASYCGLRDRKYPDRRAMGFPFDRRACAGALSDFLLPNMAVQNCIIKFSDITVEREEKKEKHSLLSKIFG